MRIILFIFILTLTIHAKSLFSNDKQADSSQYINSLKDLVVATQKTRGLTNSYLNGNLVALMLVQDSKNSMKKAIGTMESLELASDPVINQRATDISNKLMELNRKGFKLEPEVAFERYTQEIERILMLAQTVSKRSSEHMSPFAKEASSMMMEQMLPLCEYIGQLRGLGSGVAAKGKISNDQKESLLIIMGEINSLNDDFQKNMQAILVKGKKHYTQDINSRTLKINSSIEDYIKFVKKEFYKDEISVNPDDYFTKGTEIITQIISVYDENNRAILDNSKGWL